MDPIKDSVSKTLASEVGKSLRTGRRSMDQHNTMDQHKSSAVFDPFINVPLPRLDGLPRYELIFNSSAIV